LYEFIEFGSAELFDHLREVVDQGASSAVRREVLAVRTPTWSIRSASLPIRTAERAARPIFSLARRKSRNRGSLLRKWRPHLPIDHLAAVIDQLRVLTARTKGRTRRTEHRNGRRRARTVRTRLVARRSEIFTL
jgi:hypothetical protein